MNRKQRRLHLQQSEKILVLQDSDLVTVEQQVEAVSQPLKRDRDPIVKAPNEIYIRKVLDFDESYDSHLAIYRNMQPCYSKCDECEMSRKSWLTGKLVPSSLCHNIIKTDDELNSYLKRKGIKV